MLSRQPPRLARSTSTRSARVCCSARGRFAAILAALLALPTACGDDDAPASGGGDVAQADLQQPADGASPADGGAETTGGTDAAPPDGASQAAEPTIAPGDDWWLPDGVPISESSGFFSEELAAEHNVLVRVVDVTWRQMHPAPGVLDTTSSGSAQGLEMPSYDAQLAGADPFWMRIWASGVTWAPEWVAQDCGVGPIGTDDDGQQHLPLWDPCVWGHLMDLYRLIFLDGGLRSDPRLKMIYVPGAFAWCEFDFDVIAQAAASGLTQEAFSAWFQTAMDDLVTIFDGDNEDDADDYSYKLVYTGEDYPFGPWGAGDDLFALQAVQAGLGIRTGISELFNFHLSHVPSYGTTIAEDGHMVTDSTWPLLDGRRIVATENECFNDCGYATSEPYYAVKMSNLKTLQLRANWLYVYPGPSYMAEYPEHYEWVRRSLGKTVDDSPDAWVALREAQDLYWIDDTSYTWSTHPWVINYERFMVQRDVEPDGVSARGTDLHSQQVGPDNGDAWEGRRTDLAQGTRYLYFDVDDDFLFESAQPVTLKITYKDEGSHRWAVEYAGAGGPTSTGAVQNGGSGDWMTATFQIPDAVFDNSLPGGTDFRIDAFDGGDVEASLVRLIR